MMDLSKSRVVPWHRLEAGQAAQGCCNLALIKWRLGSGAGANFGMFGKPSSWPTGPRIGSLDGATVGVAGASRAPFVYFAAVLQPATRLVIGQSSLCCPASGLPSLHFQVGCCSCKLPCASFGPAWLRSPRPGPSPPTCACPHSHLYIHRHTHTHPLLESPSYRVRWHLFACRKPRTECEVFSFPHIPHSLVRSLVGGASLHLLFLAICAVKSRPGLSCCWPVLLPASLCLSFSTIILLHTCCAHFAATNRPILFLFVRSCPCHASFRLSIHSLPLGTSRWQTDRKTDRQTEGDTTC